MNKTTGALIIHLKYTAPQQIRLDIQIYFTTQQVQFAPLVEFTIYEILHLLPAINNLHALILKQTFVKILGKFWLISPTTNALPCNVVVISVLD